MSFLLLLFLGLGLGLGMEGMGANGLQLLRRLRGSFRARCAAIAVANGDVDMERLRREILGRECRWRLGVGYRREKRCIK